MAQARQIDQGFCKVPVGVFLKIPQHPGVQLLFVQPRLQVDFQMILMVLKITQMGAGGEHQRTGDAEVGKEHFAQLGIELLAALVEGREYYVAQRKTLHFAAAGVIRLQRYQRGSWRRHGVAQLSCAIRYPSPVEPVAG